ncbi:hypothetical protein [Pseudorhodobacter sp.]|uniref:hypothetical protein n=1 Tax=Pseudorhodobacter sp. TaxID=1934400 RepID=UPI002AFE4060|nr:hypothetical protein [Pseudorhodobacter sp.]
MANLAVGTIVHKKPCPNCAGDVYIKLNKNGNAYFYCNGSDESGKPCSHHERYGKAASQRLQLAFIQKTRKTKTLGVEDDKTLEPIRADNDNEKPSGGNFLFGG